MIGESSGRFFRSLLPGLLLAALTACAGPSAEQAGGTVAPIAPGKGVDDFVLVDCLLPGQIRQLGTRMTYLAPRRMVKSTKTDCGIRGGEFVLFDRSDYGTALSSLLPKAQSGDPVAQTYVGEIYEKGLGLSAPDYASAAGWYHKAADQGNRSAQVSLGSLYERGLGVPKEQTRALNLYRSALGITEEIIPKRILEDQRQAFQREIAVRNQVANSLRSRLRAAEASRPKDSGGAVAAVGPSPTQLRRQAESQRLDAESAADQVRKQLHAIDRIKESDASSGQVDSGKTAQLGKMELTMTEQYRALLDTSKRLSLAQQGGADGSPSRSF